MVYKLAALEPARYARVADTLVRSFPRSRAELEAAFHREGVALDQEYAAEWATATERAQRDSFAGLLVWLAAAERWDLGSGLGFHALGGVLPHIPEFRELPLLTFEGTDVAVPEGASGGGDWLGIWSAGAVDRWPDIERFAERSAVERYEPPRGRRLWRLRDGEAKSRAAALLWLEPYNWECWSVIVDAVRNTKKERLHLALWFGN